MERLFLGVIGVVLLILLRFILISDPHLGAAVTGIIAITFLILGSRYAFNNANTGVIPDLDNPDDHDLDDDPHIVEVAKRCVNGIG